MSAIRTTLLAGVVATVALAVLHPVDGEYHPSLGRFGQRDPAGYADGMNLYEYERSSPVGQLDPSGARVFYAKSEVKANKNTGKKTGTIILYNLLRYEPSEDFQAAYGKHRTQDELKNVAAEHKKILERYFNEAGNVYDDGEVEWKLHMKVIITTRPPYTLEQKWRDTKELGPRDPERVKHEVRHRIYGDMAGTSAFTAVKVALKPRDTYTPRLVPGKDFKAWKNSYDEMLAHELIFHHLNNMDEYYEPWKLELEKRLGHRVEQDSIGLAQPVPGKWKFYNRHFAAAIDDMHNIYGRKIEWGDYTTELSVKDSWFAEIPGLSEELLRQLNRITGKLEDVR